MDCPDRWPRLVVEAACEHAACSDQGFETLEAVVRLAVELGHEGREGHNVGTMMTVGDADSVLERSHALILDPLAGHDAAVRQVEDREFRQTVKELAQLDGAFVVDDDGTFRSAARFVEVNVGAAKNLPAGLGARHASAASISETTEAVAVAVSESSFVRVFAGGGLRAEIAPGLFLGTGGAAFAMGDPQVHELPDLGLTIALEAERK